ncbi:class I SAM-dependent methyltransferase [Thermopirellula anaerolimosa]
MIGNKIGHSAVIDIRADSAKDALVQDAQFDVHAQLEERHWWFTARRRIVQRLLSLLIPPGALVIDIGCGTGANIASLVPPYRGVGIDPAAAALVPARRRFPSVEFIQGEAPAALGTRFAEGDAFLMLDVLEHVADDQRLFDEVTAAARSGAVFLITVPADPELWSPHDEAFGHYRRYTLGSLRALWRGRPLIPWLCSYYCARLYPIIRTVRRWTAFRCRSAGREGTDFRLPPRPLNRFLERLFAGEGAKLEAALRRHLARGSLEEPPPFRRGSSLIAVLRKE